MLALFNPKFQVAIGEVLSIKPSVANLSSLMEQFSSLIINPINLAMDNECKEHGSNYVVVLDTLDESSVSGVVQTLIRTILNGILGIPLKFFITS